MKPILVTGANGTIGRQVVSALLANDIPVRALSRNPNSAGLPQQVDVVRGDLTVPSDLEPCLADIDAIFLVWTSPVDAVQAAVDRIAKRARSVVVLSSPYQTPHPFFQQPNPMAALHAEIERAIKASSLSWTFLRPGMFAANSLSWWASQIRAGNVVRWPYAAAATAPIDERDIAAVAAHALLQSGGDNADYVLTGPESLTQQQQVETIGEVLGRCLRYEELSPTAARRELQMPPAVVDMLLNAWAAAVGLPAYVTSNVAKVTGHPARTFRDWVTDHAEEFRSRSSQIVKSES
jgi:uncharacterized protein YbjT (DUF2867 family)